MKEKRRRKKIGDRVTEVQRCIKGITRKEYKKDGAASTTPDEEVHIVLLCVSGRGKGYSNGNQLVPLRYF
jgi:hypothetical protein